MPFPLLPGVLGILASTLAWAVVSPAHAFAGNGCPAQALPSESPELTIGPMDSLSVSLSLPERVRSGESVPFTFRIVNVSGRPLHLYLQGREITFDATVTTLAGSPVWRRLEGEILPAILRLETLEAGGILQVAGSWDQTRDTGERAAPGVYCLQAELLTEGAPLQSPWTEFEIAGGG